MGYFTITDMSYLFEDPDNIYFFNENLKWLGCIEC